MRFPRIVLLFLTPCLYLELTLAVATGKLYTLFPGNHTWNEAKDICNTSGLTMLRIESEIEKIAFSRVLRQWKESGKLTTDIWTGLYGKAANIISDAVYQWEASCDVLGDYQPWADNEPDQQQGHYCVGISADRIYFKTEKCNQLYHAVCQQNSDTCGFKRQDVDVSKFREVASSLHLVENDCKKRCNSLKEACVGAFWERTDVTLCTLYARSKAPDGTKNNVIYMNTKLCISGFCRFSEEYVKEDDYEEIFQGLVPRRTDACKKKCEESLYDNCVGLSVLHFWGVNCTVYTYNKSTDGSSVNSIPVYLKWCHEGVYNATVPSVKRNHDDLPEDSCGHVTSTSVNSSSQGHTCKDDAFRSICVCDKNQTWLNTDSDASDNVEGLRIVKNILSSYRRSKTSADDDRPSAISIGLLGVAVLVSVAVSVMVMDINRFVTWAKRMNAK